MNTIKFAQLISYISNVAGCTLATESVEAIHGSIGKMIDANSVNENACSREFVIHNVDAMFDAIRNKKLIEAIRYHRLLTGYGLKESKDAIESIM